jgi:hypothetical protein
MRSSAAEAAVSDITSGKLDVFARGMASLPPVPKPFAPTPFHKGRDCSSNVPWLGRGVRFVHGNFRGWIDWISPRPKGVGCVAKKMTSGMPGWLRTSAESLMERFPASSRQRPVPALLWCNAACDSTICLRSGPRNQTDSGRRNRSTVNEFSPTERLGRGAYESPRPGTLGPTDETVSTVTESGWPDDAHRGRCFFRWYDRGLSNLPKSAARAVGLDGRSNGSSFSS